MGISEHWYWQTDDPSHQLTVGGGFISDRVSSISIEDAGSGYSMPCKVIILGGFPQLTNERYDDYLPPYTKTITDGSSPGIPYNFREAEIVVSKIDTNGSILDFTILDPGIGYVPYRNIPKTDPEPFTGAPKLGWPTVAGSQVQFLVIILMDLAIGLLSLMIGNIMNLTCPIPWPL